LGTRHHRTLCLPSKQENACAGVLTAESKGVNFSPRVPKALKATNEAPNAAFTLIELLVVIAIIAVLMGLLFPAGQSAINSANKTTAKNQAVQIATAITAYETEYGRFPTSSVTSMSGGLLNELCTTNNPRGIIFLEANAWKKGKGGTNSSGFCDPFGSNTVYQVAMDTGYSNSITAAGTTMNRRVGVWTVWTNRSTVNLINSWD
jgi:prepilin-type N-terminal cleavage/methylation domain-containing protein